MSWIDETLYPGWGQRFRVRRELAREHSLFQDIVIVESEAHGRVLLLDGVVQITEADDFVYQEMITHVPLLQHGAAERVLIIGAGDGGVLRQVLRHRAVQHVTMVEIDEAVIRLTREHMPNIADQAWADPRSVVIVGDGIEYVAEAANEAFDVIIIDSTDPAGPGEGLFTTDFYQHCARILSPRGLVVNQAGVPFMQADELRETSRRRAAAFQHVDAYVAAVPTYVGGLLALGIASAAPIERLSTDEIATRARRSGILGATSYWSPAIHNAAFALPPYIASLLPG